MRKSINKGMNKFDRKRINKKKEKLMIKGMNQGARKLNNGRVNKSH